MIRHHALPMRASLARTLRLVVGGLVAAGALVAAAPADADAACRNTGLALTAARTATVERATECLVNEARAANGVRRLRASSALRRSSYRYASRMVRGRFFSHNGGGSPESRMSAYRAGARGWRVGENLAYARRQATARKIVNQWLRSSGHRRTMLEPSFRHIGIGARTGTPRGGRRGGTFVLHVGRR